MLSHQLNAKGKLSVEGWQEGWDEGVFGDAFYVICLLEGYAVIDLCSVVVSIPDYGTFTGRQGRVYRFKSWL